MANFRLIQVAKPFLAIMPEVEIPYENLQFDDRVVYTLIVALVYVFGQFPLAGISKEPITVMDPYYFIRGVFAAERRTLMEFGIFPPAATALIFQLLAGLKIIRVNFKNRQERELFQSTMKLVSVLQYAVLANVLIFSGYYGSSLSMAAIFILNVQLIGAGIFTTLMIEIIDKGFGFGSGIMAISAIAISTSFVGDAFGITQVLIDSTEQIKEPQGAIINLIQGLRSKHKSFLGSIVNAFQRDYLPNLTTVLLMVVLAAAIGLLHNLRQDLPIRSTRARGMNNVYPIRILYTSGISILFSYTILFYIHTIGFIAIQLIAKNDPSHIITRVLGRYTTSDNLYYTPSFPLSLLAPPKSLWDGLLHQPLSIITFTLFLITTGVWFAVYWQDISGSSARDIGAQFKEQGIALTGRREQSASKELEKVIPVAAGTGAAVLALLTSAGEILGLKGAGAAIIFGFTSALSMLELVVMDFQQSGGQSALAQAFGGMGGF